MVQPEAPSAATAPSGGTSDRATPDAVARSWVDRLPVRLRLFARLARFDRPIGSWLLFWPCAWGLALAGGLSEHAPVLVAFAVGAFVMRGAGCVYNDIVDRDLDARVARTRDRPVASGRVSVRAAWAWLVALSLTGLLVLLQLRSPAQVIALGSLALVAAYPFMKRITWWPQAWLGLTFNWGVLVAWAEVDGRLSPAALLLYAGGLFWTLGYDTIYALQDIEDDAIAGIKSTARRLADHVRGWTAGFYAACVALIGSAILVRSGDPLALAALLPAALHMAWQWRTLRPSDPENALRLFRANARTGGLIFAGCAVAGSV
jgi:4-hydroxybenzoate polyprenyltransferase